MIEQLNQMVAEGKIQEVLNELKVIFEKSNRLNEVIMQSARYNGLKDKIRNGIIEYEQETVSKNKIILAILELINQIDDALLSDTIIQNELESYETKPTISQNHSGTGHNIGGDFIINN